MVSREEIEQFINEAGGHIEKGEKEVLLFEENPNNYTPIQELYFSFYSLRSFTAEKL